MIQDSSENARKSSKKPNKPAKFPRSYLFKASISRLFPYIDTSALESRQFPPLPNDTRAIMLYVCTYLNRRQALCFYVILSSLFTKDIRALSRESIQKSMRTLSKKYFGKEQVFDVGDISKITNLLDALGLIAKKYCATNGDKYANRYMAHPLLRDNLFRKKVLGLLHRCFSGDHEFKLALRINRRWAKKGSYFKTIMSIWHGVFDHFLSLIPTHEQEESIFNNTQQEQEESSSQKGWPESFSDSVGELEGVPLQSESISYKIRLPKGEYDAMSWYVDGQILSVWNF